MSEFKNKVTETAEEMKNAVKHTATKVEHAAADALHKAKEFAAGKGKHTGNTITEKVHVPPAEPTVIVSDDATKRPNNWVKNTNS